jgi:hypothetical protein
MAMEASASCWVRDGQFGPPCAREQGHAGQHDCGWSFGESAPASLPTWKLPTVTRFIPKRACEGGPTVVSGHMAECQHPDCRLKVTADLADHHFYGFAASCPLKAREKR